MMMAASRASRRLKVEMGIPLTSDEYVEYVQDLRKNNMLTINNILDAI